MCRRLLVTKLLPILSPYHQILFYLYYMYLFFIKISFNKNLRLLIYKIILIYSFLFYTVISTVLNKNS